MTTLETAPLHHYNRSRSGNAVLGGDAKVECTLCMEDRLRTDIETFRKHYGLYPETVAIIGKLPGNNHDLNRHAALVASRFKNPSLQFHALFASFISKFEQGELGLEVTYLSGVETEVTSVENHKASMV
ncbi:hypothetical protein HOY82DRAFT_596345 [Tuber indicum]|nr:hypothetical protein HOY82DRAFT_596345 [Tuber indicum]